MTEVDAARSGFHPFRLETPRLVIRSAEPADLEVVKRLELDPDVRRFLGGPASAEDVAAIRPAMLGKRWGSCLFEVVGLGVAGAVGLDRQRRELEVSYLQLPEFWGSGYATEAVRGLLGWAARECPENHVIAVTQAANPGSRALLDRLGFTLRETFEEFGATQVLLERESGPGGTIEQF